MNSRRIELLQEAVSAILASRDLTEAAEIAKRANEELLAITDPVDREVQGAVGSAPEGQ